MNGTDGATLEYTSSGDNRSVEIAGTVEVPGTVDIDVVADAGGAGGTSVPKGVATVEATDGAVDSGLSLHAVRATVIRKTTETRNRRILQRTLPMLWPLPISMMRIGERYTLTGDDIRIWR